MDAWRVRPARPDDAPVLLEMLRQAFSWDPSQPAWSTEATLAHPMAARYALDWGRAGDVGMVAVDPADRAFGAAWYRRFDPDAPGYGFLGRDVPELSIGVAPGRRGQGVGWALLWALLFEAAGMGVPALSLSVAVDNPAARLYRRLGFVPVAEEGGSWTMRRDLARLPQLAMTYPGALPVPAATVPAGYALRPYRATDEDPFYALMDGAGWPGWDADRLRPYRVQMAPDGWVVAVEERTGDLVASAMALLDDPSHPEQGGELGWVAADLRHAGRGLGAAVVAAATAGLVALRCARVHLRTEDFRLAAIRTYLRQGWVPAPAGADVAERWQEIGRRLGLPGALS
jgi:mycothiol synthase